MIIAVRHSQAVSQQAFEHLVASLVVSQGLFGVARLAATSQKVAQLVETHRQIALGAGSVWLSLEQALYDGLGGLKVAAGSGSVV
jgi:hypothetical protein